MTRGPVQLIMLGFDDPNFTGEIKAELSRLRDSDVVRLLDAIVIQKDAAGNVALLDDEDVPSGDESGAVAALIGLVELETEVLAAAAAPETDELDAWTVDDLLPDDTAAAIALIEHRWAVGLRDAIDRANGTLLNDTWVSPDDLELIGALAGEEPTHHG